MEGGVGLLLLWKLECHKQAIKPIKTNTLPLFSFTPRAFSHDPLPYKTEGNVWVGHLTKKFNLWLKGLAISSKETTQTAQPGIHCLPLPAYKTVHYLKVAEASLNQNSSKFIIYWAWESSNQAESETIWFVRNMIAAESATLLEKSNELCRLELLGAGYYFGKKTQQAVPDISN